MNDSSTGLGSTLELFFKISIGKRNIFEENLTTASLATVSEFRCVALNLASAGRPCRSKHSRKVGRVNSLLKLNCISFIPPVLFLCRWLTVIEIGNVSPADNNDLNDRYAAYKKLQQKVTKQTGQCLTLSSVRLDLLSCCCFCPSFWAKSLHVGIHSTALTSLLGHELSYLWDMNRTWPRAQITAREEERPWQQRAVAQLSPSSPLLLGGFWIFFSFSL